MACRQTDVLRRRGIDRLFEADLEAILISPGGERGARRRADRRVRVALGEHQSFQREPIDVRRRVVALAVAADVAVAQVVRQDEDDVRFDGLSQARTTETGSGQRERAQGARLNKPTTRNQPAPRHVSLPAASSSTIHV